MSVMEMPEGWTHWKNNTNLLPDDMAVWITKREKDFTAELMKEMAEALDALAYDLMDKKIPETEGANLCMMALKKFEDWK